MRIQIQFSDEQMEKLRALMKETGIKTHKDLFNTALSLFRWVVDETGDGNEIASVSQQQETYKVLTMPALQHVKVEKRKIA